MADLSLYDLNNKIEAYKILLTHPDTHPATMIVEDSTHRFVSDTQISIWNAKANTSTATASSDGLMSAADKAKLNGVQSGAEINQFAYSNIKVGASIVTANTKTTTLELIAGANIQLTPDGIAKTITITNTYEYIHPATHSAAMIVEDSTRRFVSDNQITTWNAKATTAVASGSTDGLMSAADKLKLDGVQAGAQVNPNATAILTSARAADAAGSWARVSPASPREGDITTNSNGYVWIYAAGAWRQVFPAIYG
jgi:hypothetical protein